MPLRIIPDLGQVSENSAHPSTKQLCDVLHDDKAGSKLANEAGIFRPQARSFPVETARRASPREILARKPATDDIDGNSIGSKSFAGKLADIAVAGDIGPVLGEDAAGEVFDFAERDCFKAARPFEAKREPSYAAEKIEDAQHQRKNRARDAALRKRRSRLRP